MLIFFSFFIYLTFCLCVYYLLFSIYDSRELSLCLWRCSSHKVVSLAVITFLFWGTLWYCNIEEDLIVGNFLDGLQQIRPSSSLSGCSWHSAFKVENRCHTSFAFLTVLKIPSAVWSVFVEPLVERNTLFFSYSLSFSY